MCGWVGGGGGGDSVERFFLLSHFNRAGLFSMLNLSKNPQLTKLNYVETLKTQATEKSEAVRCRAGGRRRWRGGAGPGRAVAGGVRWGGRGACASKVGARPCRGPALQGFGRGRRGARCCCAGGVRVGRSRCTRSGGSLRPSSRRRTLVLAGVSRGLECSACNRLTSVRAPVGPCAGGLFSPLAACIDG